MIDAVAIINQHYPSMSEADEDAITHKVFAIVQESLTFGGTLANDETDVAELAQRTCTCGVKLEDTYAYVDHIKNVLSDHGTTDG